jgi:ankyrin repeat protein
MTALCVRCPALIVRAVRSDNTALHCAALPVSAAAGALLLAAGACARACDEDGDSPLHEACRWERVALARALLAAGADIDAANCCGWTPLHCAAAYGREAAMALLLEAGADAEALTGESRSAAQLAKTDALRRLIQAHVDAESDS